jgi:hypothetical protein
MGQVVNGKYYPGKPDLSKSRPVTNKMSDSWKHDDQRYEHRRDILQPYNKDGSVNDEFVEAYPSQAREHGLIKEDRDV